MPAQRIAQQPVARQPVEAFEALAHVRRPRSQIDPRRRPQPNMLRAAQHTQQQRQGVGVNPRPISIRRPLGRATAKPLLAPSSCIGRPAHSFTSTQRFPAAGLPCVLPLPIAGQRGQAQPRAFGRTQPGSARWLVFGHQLPGFRATPAAPNFYYRCLLVHPSTASRTAAQEQMGCSKRLHRNSGQ